MMSEFDQKTQDFHDAARAGDAPKIERMIRFVGMDPDEELNGLSPIHVAAAAGHCEATQALLRLGASVGKISHEGKSALMYAAESNNTKVVRVLLQKIEASESSPKQQPASSARPHVLQADRERGYRLYIPGGVQKLPSDSSPAAALQGAASLLPSSDEDDRSTANMLL
uniref:Uncharacterized protein n=1 Tax=Hanusia phi TaxID=3032 RepID=A0A7S0HZB6_9CRYP